MSGKDGAGPAAVQVIPMAQSIVLETAGPPLADTAVAFTTGEPRVIVLRHGPPESITFAELAIPPAAFGDSGRQVRIEIKPRPGVYGVDINASLPFGKASGKTAMLTFKYGRYFLAPAKARAVYGDEVQFERALAIGRVLPNGQLALLPSTRPASDNLSAPVTTAGTYLVAAPQ